MPPKMPAPAVVPPGLRGWVELGDAPPVPTPWVVRSTVVARWLGWRETYTRDVRHGRKVPTLEQMLNIWFTINWPLNEQISAIYDKRYPAWLDYHVRAHGETLPPRSCKCGCGVKCVDEDWAGPGHYLIYVQNQIAEVRETTNLPKVRAFIEVEAPETLVVFDALMHERTKKRKNPRPHPAGPQEQTGVPSRQAGSTDAQEGSPPPPPAGGSGEEKGAGS